MAQDKLDPVSLVTGGKQNSPNFGVREHLKNGALGEYDPNDTLRYSQQGLQRYGGPSAFEGRDILPQDYMAYLTALAGGTMLGQGEGMARQAVRAGMNQAVSIGASAQGVGAGAGASLRAGQNQANQIGAQGQSTIAGARFQDQNMARQALLGQLQQQQQMNDTGQLNQEQMYMQMLAAQTMAQRGVEETQAAREAQFTGAAMQGAGALMGGMCDKELKTDIQNADELVEETLAQLEPYTFKYRDPSKFGSGEHIGIMAQDMPKHTTLRTEDGLMVDLRKALMFALAALAHEHKERKGLERRLELLEQPRAEVAEEKAPADVKQAVDNGEIA